MNYMNIYQYQPNLMTAHQCEGTWRQENFLHPESSGELTRDGTDVVAESHERSTIEVEMEDTFGLEFAAVQWLNLVTNAEELFNKLLHSIVLSGDEKEQIQRWLCLKQECEECVASDGATSVGECHRHSLDRIEELTEDTGGESSDSNGKLTDSQYESETESDFDSHHPDFEAKLDGYLERFKDRTDTLIRNKLMREEDTAVDDLRVKELRSASISHLPCSSGFRRGRRKSILHPGTSEGHLNIVESCREEDDTELSFGSESSGPKLADYQNTLSLFSGASSSSLEPYKELKILSSENDAKKTQIKQVVLDLEGAQKRMEELEHTILIKEQFIKDMNKNSETRESAKLKFERKLSKLEEEYYKTRTQLAQAQNALHETRLEGAQEALMMHKGEVKKYKNLARHYEKRLHDIDGIIKKIAGDSAKKVLELEDSLLDSKKQMEKMKKQLQKEEVHKHKLEKELQEDQKKMKALEEKYNMQVTKLLEKDKDGNGVGNSERLKWIAEETERLTVMRESSQKLHQQLIEQQKVLDKREAFMKEKASLEKQRTKNIMEVSAKISQLESALKEKSSTLDKSEAKDKRESLRQEIRNLRKTRDCLLDQRSSLDEKFQKDQTLSSSEERTRLQCEEAIEAIDAAIEYKNELICGRKGLECEEQSSRDQGEQMLMDRLLKLSTDEMRTLLYKYFQKVIDLRESGRKMEQQVYELEHQNERSAWHIQELTHELETQRLEAERHEVTQQRENQEKLHLMLRHFAEESSSSGTEAGRHLALARENDLGKIKRENKQLKRRLQELQALVRTAALSRDPRFPGRSSSPDRTLKPLPPPPPPSTTKVMREKNKVIIQYSVPKSKNSKM